MILFSAVNTVNGSNHHEDSQDNGGQLLSDNVRCRTQIEISMVGILRVFPITLLGEQ